MVRRAPGKYAFLVFGFVRERERKEVIIDNAPLVCLFLVEAGGGDKGHARLTAGSVAEQGGRACLFGDDQPVSCLAPCVQSLAVNGS
jgi:hypothetical protein